MEIKSFDEFINESFNSFFKNVNLSSKTQIEKWCIDMNIKNFKIVEDPIYGYKINVDGSVNLSNKGLIRIPYKFGTVTKSFYCSDNNLQTLENSPDIVGEYFSCSNNPNLKTLEGGPKKVGIRIKKFNAYSCKNCGLETLKGAPEKINGHFYCQNNKLKNLIGAPKLVEGVFDCSNNLLESLEGSPEKIRGSFICSNNPNLKSLANGPKNINESYICNNCSIETLKDFSINQYYIKKFDISDNKLKKFDNIKEIVFDEFICSGNELISLENLPLRIVKYFECENNRGPKFTRKDFQKYSKNSDIEKIKIRL